MSVYETSNSLHKALPSISMRPSSRRYLYLADMGGVLGGDDGNLHRHTPQEAPGSGQGAAATTDSSSSSSSSSLPWWRAEGYSVMKLASLLEWSYNPGLHLTGP